MKNKRRHDSFFVINIDAFHKEPLEFDLVFACVGEMNTTIRAGLAWPMIYGVGKWKVNLDRLIYNFLFILMKDLILMFCN